MKTVIVTGWAGFIGSNLIRYLLDKTDWKIVGLDCETYAARPLWAMQKAQSDKRFKGRWEWHNGDIRDADGMNWLVKVTKPDIIIHLAAESHVCRSIEGPDKFIETNINGTFNLLEAVRKNAPECLFHHVSTDEVFGELGKTGEFTELTPYAPRSPYAASKASSDHLVRAYHETYKLNTRTTNCSNNFGPNQHLEKLVPKTIMAALSGKPITVYGSGAQVRDWIWVEDHCEGIHKAITSGKPGGQYLLGGKMERSNLEVIEDVWNATKKVGEEMGFEAPPISMTQTDDRPTDDQRYAIDCGLAEAALNWVPHREMYFNRLKETVKWYKKYSC